VLGLSLSLAACGGSASESNGGGAGDGGGQTIRIDIPKNASLLVKQGKDVPGVPDRITGSVGDTLVIDNQDSVTQFVAGYSISPGQSLKIPLNRAGDYQTNCSAHKDSSLQMSISE
jgi:hypothetical protein